MIYFMRFEEGGPIKIGTTVRLSRRAKQHALTNGNAEPIILGVMDGGPAKERELHERFAHLRTGTTPICETFHPLPELLDFVRDTARPWNKEDDAPAGGKPNAIVIRGSEEWRGWLKRAADHVRAQSVADFLDRAVAAYAREMGFKEGAPKR